MPARVEVELLPDLSAPRAGREFLHASFAAALEKSELDSAQLLVSELVTNAVLHGQGTITLRAQLDDDRLLVDVIDEGRGFERVVREHDFGDVGGWGLSVVDAVSSRWGVHEGTTHVWFELERAGPRVGAAEKPPIGEPPKATEP